MEDETLSEPLPLPRPRRTAAVVVPVALLAFLFGGAVVGWLAQTGRLPYAVPVGRTVASRSVDSSVPSPVPSPVPTAPPPSKGELGSIEMRMAMLEDRLSRLDLQADAASGNASRAEALLIAYAARRRIDQGEQLGFIEEQLKLRFGGAQPKAVQTIIASARRPLTLDELSAQLDATAPMLTGRPRQESTWARVRRELASLFVVRRAPVSSTTPQDRISHARLMLASGRIDDAITEVEHLPGADAAQGWIEAARRYEDTQRALDLIETTAMLEPRNLQDSNGKPVRQPSPLAPPADSPPTPD
jgi:hypothetical protein